MMSSISFATGLLALSPLAAAGPVKRQEGGMIVDSVSCLDSGVPMGELDGCIQSLRDRGDAICSFTHDFLENGYTPPPAFCYQNGVRVTGLVNDGAVTENPTCNAVAGLVERVKNDCTVDGAASGFAYGGGNEAGLVVYVQFNTGAEEDWPVNPRSV